MRKLKEILKKKKATILSNDMQKLLEGLVNGWQNLLSKKYLTYVYTGESKNDKVHIELPYLKVEDSFLRYIIQFLKWDFYRKLKGRLDSSKDFEEKLPFCNLHILFNIDPQKDPSKRVLLKSYLTADQEEKIINVYRKHTTRGNEPRKYLRKFAEATFGLDKYARVQDGLAANVMKSATKGMVFSCWENWNRLSPYLERYDREILEIETKSFASPVSKENTLILCAKGNVEVSLSCVGGRLSADEIRHIFKTFRDWDDNGVFLFFDSLVPYMIVDTTLRERFCIKSQDFQQDLICEIDMPLRKYFKAVKDGKKDFENVEKSLIKPFLKSIKIIRDVEKLRYELESQVKLFSKREAPPFLNLVHFCDMNTINDCSILRKKWELEKSLLWEDFQNVRETVYHSFEHACNCERLLNSLLDVLMDGKGCNTFQYLWESVFLHDVGLNKYAKELGAFLKGESLKDFCEIVKEDRKLHPLYGSDRLKRERWIFCENERNKYSNEIELERIIVSEIIKFHSQKTALTKKQKENDQERYKFAENHNVYSLEEHIENLKIQYSGLDKIPFYFFVCLLRLIDACDISRNRCGSKPAYRLISIINHDSLDKCYRDFCQKQTLHFMKHCCILNSKFEMDSDKKSIEIIYASDLYSPMIFIIYSFTQIIKDIDFELQKINVKSVIEKLSKDIGKKIELNRSVNKIMKSGILLKPCFLGIDTGSKSHEIIAPEFFTGKMDWESFKNIFCELYNIPVSQSCC